jgi:hypothetical protein
LLLQALAMLAYATFGDLKLKINLFLFNFIKTSMQLGCTAPAARLTCLRTLASKLYLPLVSSTAAMQDKATTLANK